MKKEIIIGIVVIALIIIGALLFGGDSSASTTEQDKTNELAKKSDLDKAPTFSLQNYVGDTVSLADFDGKVRIINSWAVWCPFCVEELDDFGKLQEEFGDEIVVIAIDRQEPLSKTKEFTDNLGVTDKVIFLLDPSDSFYKSIGGFSMPETIFVNSDGDIVFHKRGPMDINEMRTRTQEAISS